MIQHEKQRFREIVERVQEGSDDAAWELIEEYGPYIRMAVRSRLNQRMRSMFDSEDFVQAVWASMVRMDPGLDEVEDPRQFVKLLTTMARNKVVDEARRRMRTVKHSIRNEVSANNSKVYEQISSSNSTASQLAVAREEWEQMIHEKSPKIREILKLKISGLTYKEIASRIGLHERTVRRAVHKVADAYRRRSAGDWEADE